MLARLIGRRRRRLCRGGHRDCQDQQGKKAHPPSIIALERIERVVAGRLLRLDLRLRLRRLRLHRRLRLSTFAGGAAFLRTRATTSASRPRSPRRRRAPSAPHDLVRRRHHDPMLAPGDFDPQRRARAHVLAARRRQRAIPPARAPPTSRSSPPAFSLALALASLVGLGVGPVGTTAARSFARVVHISIQPAATTTTADRPRHPPRRRPRRPLLPRPRPRRHSHRRRHRSCRRLEHRPHLHQRRPPVRLLRQHLQQDLLEPRRHRRPQRPWRRRRRSQVHRQNVDRRIGDERQPARAASRTRRSRARRCRCGDRRSCRAPAPATCSPARAHAPRPSACLGTLGVRVGQLGDAEVEQLHRASCRRARRRRCSAA